MNQELFLLLEVWDAKGEEIVQGACRLQNRHAPCFFLKIIETKILVRENFVSAERLELSTNGLKGHCSTIELRAHHIRRRAF